MPLKLQDALGSVAGFLLTHWKLAAAFVGGLIVGGLLF